MVLGAYAWYDKVDKTYMADSTVMARSERSVCRGYLAAFEKDKKMAFDEYELVKYGSFDDETGEFSPIYPPLRVDPSQVYARADKERGEVADI